MLNPSNIEGMSELTFNGKISKIGVVKLFKKVSRTHQNKQLFCLQMRFNMVIKMEEVVEEMIPGQPEKQKLFRKLDNSQVDFTTSVIPTPQLSYSFSETFNFEHKTKYENLTKQYLSFYFHE